MELRLQRYDELGLVQALQDALCEKTVGQLGKNDDASARERTVKGWLDAGEPAGPVACTRRTAGPPVCQRAVRLALAASGFRIATAIAASHCRGASLARVLAPAALVLALLAGGGSWLAHEGWQHWGATAATVRLLANQNAAHRAYTVEIWYRPATADLARALGVTLDRDGFMVAEKALPDKPAPGGREEGTFYHGFPCG